MVKYSKTRFGLEIFIMAMNIRAYSQRRTCRHGKLYLHKICQFFNNIFILRASEAYQGILLFIVFIEKVKTD